MGEMFPQEIVSKKIYYLRGLKAMISTDLAEMYGIDAKVLIQAVKRNIKRFPKDFMFKLTLEEAKSLRSQSVTLKRGQHIKYAPYAFTEQGVAMLSSVLNSEQAIQVNIVIMRAFVKFRQFLITHKKIADKLTKLQEKVERHDSEIQNIFEAIQQLMTVHDEPRRKKIGFISGINSN